MSTVINITDKEKAAAKVAGFKKKQPKKPRKVTDASFEAYITRFNSWAKELKTAATKGKAIIAAKEALLKKKAVLKGL